MPDTPNEVTTVEELEALPLGTWIFDAKDVPWALFDTAVMVRQRMWRSKDKHSFVSHESIALPARLGEITAPCDHTKLNWEGWQCDRCAKVINEPPPVPEPPKPEPGRQWFMSDAFGEWSGMSPDFDNIIALAEDLHARPHDRAALDRYEFEIAALARVFGSLMVDDNALNALGIEPVDTADLAHGLSLIVSHLVAQNADAKAGQR